MTSFSPLHGTSTFIFVVRSDVFVVDSIVVVVVFASINLPLLGVSAGTETDGTPMKTNAESKYRLP